MKATKELASALESLFENEDRFILVIDDEVRGEEGVYGLQLIANALCAAEKSALIEGLKEDGREGEIEEFVGGEGSRWAFADVSEPRHPRLVQVVTQIRDLSAKSSAHFVIAYHIAGTDAWKLAWSQDMKEWEAINEMGTFVRGGLTLAY